MIHCGIDTIILTREHFYHVGAKEENRNPMVEAIVTNYDASNYDYPDSRNREQLMLLAKKPELQHIARRPLSASPVDSLPIIDE